MAGSRFSYAVTRYFLLLLLIGLLRYPRPCDCRTNNFERSDLVETNDFYELVVNDVFVDKSLMIETLIKRKQVVTRILRPRKWGKTTNLDMIRRFFEIEVNDRGERIPPDNAVNRKLFLGGDVTLASGDTKRLSPLKIAGVPEVLGHLGEHPVISVSFEDVAIADNYDEFLNRTKNLLSDLFRRYRYVNDSLDRNEWKTFELYRSGKFGEREIGDSLKFLSETLFKHFRRGVYVLIDDYHQPIFRFFCRRLREQRIANPSLSDEDVYKATANVQEMHKIASVIEKILCRTLNDGNAALHQSVLTEIYNLDLIGAYYEYLKVDRAYSLTKVNNVYMESYGFTENEMSDIFRSFPSASGSITTTTTTEGGIPEAVRRWYGYNFTDIELYNPYSIRRFLAAKREYAVYWITDADEDTVVEDVLSSDAMQEDVQHLIEGRKVICEAAHDALEFFSFPTNPKALLQGGYLSIGTASRMTLEFHLPNKEIERILQGRVLKWARNKFKLTVDRQRAIAEHLAAFRVDELRRELTAILPAVPEDSFEAEVCYNGLILSLVYSLEASFDALCNVRAEWKPNIVLISRPRISDEDGKNGMEDTEDKAIIIHYKVIGISRQIEEKGKLALEKMNKKLKDLINVEGQKRVKKVLKIVFVFCRDLLGIQYQIDDNKK